LQLFILVPALQAEGEDEHPGLVDGLLLKHFLFVLSQSDELESPEVERVFAVGLTGGVDIDFLEAVDLLLEGNQIIEYLLVCFVLAGFEVGLASAVLFVDGLPKLVGKPVRLPLLCFGVDLLQLLQRYYQEVVSFIC
jgi:hypothetical protein